MHRIFYRVPAKVSYLTKWQSTLCTIDYTVTKHCPIQSIAVPRAGGVCTQQKLVAAQACAGLRAHDVLANQHLFNVYVHPHPMIHSYDRSSLFFGQLVSNRVVVRSGKSSGLLHTESFNLHSCPPYGTPDGASLTVHPLFKTHAHPYHLSQHRCRGKSPGAMSAAGCLCLM